MKVNIVSPKLQTYFDLRPSLLFLCFRFYFFVQDMKEIKS